MVQHFTDYVMGAAKLFMRHCPKEVRKDCHPWLNERCKNLVLEKHAAYGSDSFESVREKCSLALYEEYMKHVGNTREELISKKSQGKKWWSMSKTLLLQASLPEMILYAEQHIEVSITYAIVYIEILREVF